MINSGTFIGPRWKMIYKGLCDRQYYHRGLLSFPIKKKKKKRTISSNLIGILKIPITMQVP